MSKTLLLTFSYIATCKESSTNEIVCLGLYGNHFLSHTDTGNSFINNSYFFQNNSDCFYRGGGGEHTIHYRLTL